MERLFGYYCLLLITSFCLCEDDPAYIVVKNPYMEWIGLEEAEDPPDGMVKAGNISDNLLFVARVHGDTGTRVAHFLSKQRNTWYSHPRGETVNANYRYKEFLRADFPLQWISYDGNSKLINFGVLGATNAESRQLHFICRGQDNEKAHKKPGLYIPGHGVCYASGKHGVRHLEVFEILTSKIDENKLMDFYHKMIEQICGPKGCNTKY